MRLVSPTAHRVEEHTPDRINERIACRTDDRLAYYKQHPQLIEARLRDLDREWDVERWLQLNSAAVTLAGLGLAVFKDRRWLLLPVTVQAFFLQHTIRGWCPPLPLIRKMGVRTMGEIEEERRALRAVLARAGNRGAQPAHATRPDPGGVPFPPAPPQHDRPPASTRMEP